MGSGKQGCNHRTSVSRTARTHYINQTTSYPMPNHKKMAKSQKVTKSYPQNSFRKVILAKTNLSIAKDNSDMLVYLVYIEYLRQLLNDVSENGVSKRSIETAHEKLQKNFRG